MARSTDSYERNPIVAGITGNEIQALLVCFAVYPEVQREVQRLIARNDSLFNPHTELAYATLWDAIFSIVRIQGYGRISSMALRAAVSRMEGGEVMLTTHPFFEKFFDIVDRINVNDQPLGFYLNPVDGVLQRCINVRVLGAMLEGVDKNDPLLSEHIARIAGEAARRQVSSTPVQTPLGPDAELVHDEFHRVPWNVDFLDNMMTSPSNSQVTGMGHTDSLLFLGPQGGGKTVFGTYVGIRRAMMSGAVIEDEDGNRLGQEEYHVYYFLYEQPLAGNMRLRLYAMASGLPMSAIENRPVSAWPEHARERIELFQRSTGRYFHVVDYHDSHDGRNGVADIAGVLRAEQMAGRQPSLVIVDWAGVAAQRWLSAQEENGNYAADIRSALQRFGDEFVGVMQTIGCQGILLHQLAAADTARVNSEVHFSQASDCKSLSARFEFALGVSRADTNYYTRMFLTKARNVQAGRDCVVSLDGDNNRFVQELYVTFNSRSNTFVQRTDRPGTPPAAGTGPVLPDLPSLVPSVPPDQQPAETVAAGSFDSSSRRDRGAGTLDTDDFEV